MPELLYGALDYAAANPVLGLELGVRGDAVAGRPVAVLDEAPELGGEPLIRRSTHLAGPQQRTILKASRYGGLENLPAGR